MVQTCLLCLFQSADVSFENENFPQNFSDEVITPLANDLKAFRGDDLPI